MQDWLRRAKLRALLSPRLARRSSIPSPGLLRSNTFSLLPLMLPEHSKSRQQTIPLSEPIKLHNRGSLRRLLWWTSSSVTRAPRSAVVGLEN